MSFGGSTDLKYYSRLNYYKNSTDSCNYNPETNRGYSYAEQIIKKISGNIKLFNTYNFSPTTNNHQYALIEYYSDIEAEQGFRVDLPSINNISDKKDLKKAIFEKIWLHNREVVEKLWPKSLAKYDRESTAYFKRSALNAKYSRIREKINNLDYSPKNIIAKIKEFQKFDSRWTLDLDWTYLSSENLATFFEVAEKMPHLIESRKHSIELQNIQTVFKVLAYNQTTKTPITILLDATNQQGGEIILKLASFIKDNENNIHIRSDYNSKQYWGDNVGVMENILSINEIFELDIEIKNKEVLEEYQKKQKLKSLFVA